MILSLLRKILTMSRYLFYALLLLCTTATVLFPYNGTFAQRKSLNEIYVSLDIHEAKITEVFKEIEKSTGFSFAYNTRNIDRQKRLTVLASNESLASILQDISDQANLQFKRINENIHVSKAEVEVTAVIEEIIQDPTARAVTGKITSSEDGSALPGVNILVKGTSIGTTSDASGNYSIDVPSDNDILVFSFIGFVTQEIAVGSQSTVNVQLALDVATLAEVVVIGYGQVEAKDVTGTLVSLKSEDFNVGVIASPEQLMQGRVAGVQITSNSGEPGAINTIRIRGTSSVLGGNQPLYVVDGVPITNDDIGNSSASGAGAMPARNPLNFLNPNDIASMDVLKDASATAIYGSRGANGVVMITTKKGRSGTPKLDFSVQVGVSEISKKYDLLGRDAFLAAYERYNGAAAADALDQGANTDWQDAVLRTAISKEYGLSYGGGDKSSNYMFSAGYLDQEGIVEKSGLQRFSLRFNGDKRFINNKLLVSTSFTIAKTHDDQVPITVNSGFEGDLWGNALKQAPTNPIYDEDDPSGYFQLANTEPNPVAMLNLSDIYTNTLRALGSIAAEIEITDGLKFKTVYGFDQSSSQQRSAFSRLLNVTGIYNNGRAYIRDNNQNNNLWENYFTYERTFGTVNFTGLLGYSYQSFNTAAIGFEASRFRTDDLDIMLNNIASADQSALGGVVATNSSNVTDELQSYYGRFTASIKDKYILTATIRADGSTRFGGNNRYGIFPSGAFKWRLSEEAFIPDAFTELNMRVSYGVTGNQQFGHNLYTERWRYGGIPNTDWSINTGADNTNGGGFGPVSFENPDLKWESTAQFNIGFDFGFVDNRLTGALDFYDKNTSDLLTITYSAQPAPNPFIYLNLPANIINRGVELALAYDAIVGSDFQWNIAYNMAYNKNEVTNLNTFYNAGEINGQGLTGAYSQRIADGQPLYAFFVREFSGFDENGIAIYEGGDVQKFVDKSPLPTWNLGLTNNFKYKNFDLSIFFTGQLGQYVYSNTANAFFTAGSLANGRNTTKDVPETTEDKLNAPDVSTRFLYDASFVRLQNITLGYNFKLSSGVFQNLRLYLTGSNLAVFTDYPFQDPEVSVPKPVTLGSTPPVAVAGIDYTTYPRSRTIAFGVNATF
jgi:iron complex outermembrane receptor protein